MKGLSKKVQAGVKAHMKRWGLTELESINRMLETAIGRRQAQKDYADKIRKLEGKKGKKTKAKSAKASKAKSKTKAKAKSQPAKSKSKGAKRPAAKAKSAKAVKPAKTKARVRKPKDISGVEFKPGQRWADKKGRTLFVIAVEPATVRVQDVLTGRETQMKKERLAERFALEGAKANSAAEPTEAAAS